MTSAPFRIHTTRNLERYTLELHGALDEQARPALRQAVDQALHVRAPQMILDARSAALDDTGVAALLEAVATAWQAGCATVLAASHQHRQIADLARHPDVIFTRAPGPSAPSGRPDPS